MIANAAGVPILLQASNIQLQDLMGSLSPGDALKGRVVELLPQNQALINLRGQNVIAQLPAGTVAAKGDILSLTVSQVSAGEGANAASLVLKLGATLAPGGMQADQSAAAAGLTQMEQALAAAKLPATGVNLALAQTLSRLGMPLDAQNLQALSQATESLIASEQASAQGAGSALADPAVQQALQESLGQVKVAAQMAASSQDTVGLMQAARSLENALQGPAGGALSGSSAATAQDWAKQISQSVQALLDDPSQTQIQNLNALLGELSQAGLPSSNAGLQSAAPAAGALSTVPGNLSTLAAQREALAQWLGPMNQNPQAQSAAALSQGAQALADLYSDASQGATQRLIAAVQAQSPQSTPGAIQGAASGAMQSVADFYGQQAPGKVLAGVQTVQSDLNAQGFPVPRADLSTMAPETVADAVAWLNARGFPPQRPLVESVAGWLAQDRSTLPAAQAALGGRLGLSDELLAGQPGLKDAFANLAQALDASGINPEGDGLAGRLQDWASAQGLNLESGLADGTGLAASSSLAGPNGANASLRGALQNLDHQLNQTLQSTQASALSSTDAVGLNSALKASQAAVRGFNALPLQAQGAPSFDSVHLPMPVWMNGVLGDGHLSVTWRNGRERSFDDKDPVSIAMHLNTESLGPVTVSLQVWKDAASARVIASDKANAAFLEQGSDDLKAGFAANTPFALRSLDFTVADAKAAPAAGAGAEIPVLGLSLRA